MTDNCVLCTSQILKSCLKKTVFLYNKKENQTACLMKTQWKHFNNLYFIKKSIVYIRLKKVETNNNQLAGEASYEGACLVTD